MPSNVTDKFRKTKSLFSTTTTAGIDDSTGTIPLNSVSGLPTDTAITVTIDRVDSNAVATGRLERAICTISGSSLVNCVRGNDSTTAQTHPSGAVVECVWDADSINDMIDGILVGHAQLGNHTGVDTYAADAGSNDTYAVTLSPVPIAYTTGMDVKFKANTVNTGACTLNVNSLGAKDIRKGNNAALEDGDITAGSVVHVVYDGTNFRLIGITDVASTTAPGRIEIATAAETTTGTDATRAVSPDGLAGSDYGKRVVGIQVVDAATDVATGDGKAFFRIPSALNGYNLVGVAMNVYTAGTTGTMDVQIRNVTDSVDFLSTKLTIDSTETDTSTAATPAVINTSNDDVATGDKIAIDVDAVQTTKAKGLFVEMVFQLP